MGVRESREEERFLTVTKLGTGLSDEEWRKMKQRCDQFKTKKKPQQYQVDKNLTPDVWCCPKIVVEVEADNITQSSIHIAKYSLRFPRWLRFRDDKSSNQTTTLKELKNLYQLQK